MGMSIDADIFFGFTFDEGYPNFDLYEAVEEWNKQWRPTEPEDRNDYKTPEWEAWREKLHAWEKTGPGLESGTAGHSDGGHREWVGLMGYRLSAYWYPEEIPADLIREPEAEAVKVLTDFLQKHQVGELKIGWFLAPSYG